MCGKPPLAWFPYGRPFRHGLPCIFWGSDGAFQALGEGCRESYDFRQPGFSGLPRATRSVWRISGVFTRQCSYFVRLCYKKVPFVRWGQMANANEEKPEAELSPEARGALASEQERTGQTLAGGGEDRTALNAGVARPTVTREVPEGPAVAANPLRPTAGRSGPEDERPPAPLLPAWHDATGQGRTVLAVARHKRNWPASSTRTRRHGAKSMPGHVPCRSFIAIPRPRPLPSTRSSGNRGTICARRHKHCGKMGRN